MHRGVNDEVSYLNRLLVLQSRRQGNALTCFPYFAGAARRISLDSDQLPLFTTRSSCPLFLTSSLRQGLRSSREIQISASRPGSSPSFGRRSLELRLVSAFPQAS